MSMVFCATFRYWENPPQEKKKTVVGVVAIFLPEGDLFFWFLSKLVFFGVVDFVYDERIRVSNLHRAIK